MSNEEQKRLDVVLERSQNSRSAALPDPRRERALARLARVREEKIATLQNSQYQGETAAFAEGLAEPAAQTEREAPAVELSVQVPTAEEFMYDADPTIVSDREYLQVLSSSINKKEKKREMKETKTRKQAADSVFSDISNLFCDREDKVSSLLAELMKYSERLAVVQNELYIYSSIDGSFHKCDRSSASMRIRSLLPPEFRMKIEAAQYKQAYELLLIMEEIHKPMDFFAYNRPFVNCLNGVYDVVRGKMVEHSPSLAFRNCIQANYDPDAECKEFHNYLDFITSGDKELKKLWRTTMGYLWSNYTNAKMAVLIFGKPNTGKSVMCNLLEKVTGSEQVSHVDIGMMHRMEFAAATEGKLLNIVPDLKNEKLKDVGYFKSLVSHLDTISARFLYGNPKDIKSQTKMIFATNHMLEFDGSSSTDDVQAVFNRMLYIPFTNPAITASQDNKHLAEALHAERDGIFTWSMKGLKNYLDSGENFPIAKKSLELKKQNMQRYCPEQTFCSQYLKMVDGACALSRDVRNAYSEFCISRSVKRTKRLDILAYIEENMGCDKVKGRITDESGEKHNVWYYKNMQLLSMDDETELESLNDA